jgi:carbon storage regulator
MLVLSRKLGECVMIGDAIVVTVTQIDRGKVRLGITAPPDVCVVRDDAQMRAPSTRPPSQPRPKPLSTD